MNKIWKAATAVFLLAVLSCERPSSPDFNLQQSFDIPLIKNTSYQLIGEGKGAIIDSTSENFRDLFQSGPDRLVYLSTTVDFEIGSLDDIIPEVEVSETGIDSEIGNLEVDDFSSSFQTEIGDISGDPEDLDDEAMEIGEFEVEFNATGEADFEAVTGLDAGAFAPGTPIPGSAEQTVFIPLDTPDFVRAEIDRGSVRFFFTNNLGFEIQNMTAVMLGSSDSTPVPVGSEMEFGSIHHGQTTEAVLTFDSGELLEVELAVELQIQWQAQNMAGSPGELAVQASDENLFARSATGNVKSQILRPEIEPITSSNPDFEYAIVSGQPGPGEAYQLELLFINNTPLEIRDSTFVSMPQITLFNSDGEILDEPKELINLTRPGAASLAAGETAEVTVDLAGQKLTRELTYMISIGTEGGSNLTLDRDQYFLITSRTTEMKFSEVRSDIDPQEDILLEDTKDVEGDFVNAEVEEGELRLEFTNHSELPLVIDRLRLFNEESFTAKNTGRFFAMGSDIAELTNIDLPPMQTRQLTVPLEQTGISNRIVYSGTASSPGSVDPATVRSSDLIETVLEGSATLSSASSVLKPQRITVNGEVVVDDGDFRLTRDNHYVELESGLLRIHDIINEIDLDIDTLIISFPGIRTDRSGQYLPGDSLWFRLSGSNRIRRSSNLAPQPVFSKSLENVRIFAPDNRLTYHLVAVTEDTRDAIGADTVRTVLATDRFFASLDIQDLTLRSAFGEIQKRVEILGDDDGDDGIVDLFNDNEAEVTKIEDLEELSERLSGLRLINPSFDLIYDTNLGVRGTVIGAILGINQKGEEVFLSGKPGSSREVGPADDFGNLYKRGAPISRSDLIAFQVEPAQNIGEVIRNQVVRFDSETSNVEDFLSNLPVEIRFIGNIVANPEGEEGFIVNPVIFDAGMGIDIPINLSTKEGDPATFEEIFSADLSSLPEPDDDLRISEATFFISYENGLPFASATTLTFLDDHDRVITSAVGLSVDPVSFRIKAAGVNSQTRFVDRPISDVLEVRLTSEQLENLHKTRRIRMLGELETSRESMSGEVKVRADDFIGLSVNASFQTSVKVN
jgi:hypothetical protein